MQFHDDDAVPSMNNMTDEQIIAEAKRVKGVLDANGLKAEFVAPRLWMDPAAWTAASPRSAEDRQFAVGAPCARLTSPTRWGADKLVLWLARGPHARRAKSAVRATRQIIDAIDAMLDYEQEHQNPR